MTHTQVKRGQVYVHRWSGIDWKVRIKTIEKELDASRPGTWSWTGELVDDQATCKAGDAVWGYVSELSNAN